MEFEDGGAINQTGTFTLDMSEIMKKVFGWMFVGLIISGVVAWAIGNIDAITLLVYTNPVIMFGSVILELILVLAMSFGLRKMSYGVASTCFVIYSIVNGVTLSSIFLVYELSSIATIFFVSAAMFGTMALIGAKTKIDLTKFGSIFLFGLVALIIATLINILVLQSTMLDLILTWVGLGLFLVITIFDIQKIGQLSETIPESNQGNLAIYGALQLYLDFINIFLKLLRLFGRRK